MSAGGTPTSVLRDPLPAIDPARIEVRLRPWFLRFPAGRYLVVVDVAVFAVSALLAGWLGWTAVLLVALQVGTFRVHGLYKSRLTMSVLDDFPYLVRGVGSIFLVAVAVGAVQGTGPAVAPAALLAGTLLVLVTGGRVLAYAMIREARRAGLVRHAAVVVGAGHVGIRLAQTLLDRRELGVDPLGFVDDNPRVRHPGDLPAPLLGGYKQLSEVLNDFGVRIVIVAFGSLSESALIDLLRTCDRLRCEIFLVPRLFEVHATTRDLDEIRGTPLVRVRRAPFRRTSWRTKRLVDIVLAGGALVLLAPVLAACALAVRLDGGPGVLFRQVRVGLDDRPFDILKFRSLRPASSDEASTLWNVAQDARMTRIGRFLRRTSLDELPQLWNIVRGDMSLVGPRPERPHFVNEFSQRIPRYTARHRVPAGLTGWAQVNGLRGDTSIEDRARFDNYYVENWSLWMDAKIIIRTVAQVVRRQGG